jgi:hypothetical protein
MQEEQVMSSLLRNNGRHKASNIAIGLLAVILTWSPANSKMTLISLSELVRKSDLIVYGHLNSSAGAPGVSHSLVSFQPESILKGKAIAGAGSITFCDSPSDELPDLSKITGTLLVFASKKPDCFELSHGDRSIVQVEADIAKTVAIRDQPEAQSLKTLLKKIRSLVAAQI